MVIVKPEDLRRKRGQKEYRAWAGDKITTREESIAADQLYYYTGEPCKYGHTDLRYVKTNTCLTCQREACLKYNRTKRVILPPSEEIKARKKLSRHLARLDNLEEARQKDRERAREWRKKNPGKTSIYNAPYRKAREKSTPTWLTKEHKDQIKDLVKLRIKKTKETGILHEVDHIYPLKGKTVCGLHVPWNMRVVTKTENAVKWCKMPDEVEGIRGW